MSAVTLHRIDPARNMSRFYQLDLQPDLFGGGLLMMEWGRIGVRGRIIAEHYDTKALAVGPCSDKPNGKGGEDMSRRALNVSHGNITSFMLR
jgi:predicted DNA-binding WGR domain protein